MDPNWQALAPDDFVQPELDSPLVTRQLATLPADNRYRVRILRSGSLVECFVGDQVAASYRIYETSPTPFGLFVREGSARFEGLVLKISLTAKSVSVSRKTVRHD